MHPSGLLSRSRVLLVAVALSLSVPVLAETILFKDGFTLTGNVIRQKKTIVDPISNTPVELQEGFFLLDDGARAVIFSPAHLQDVEGKHTPPEVQFNMRIPVDIVGTKPLPPLGDLIEAEAWDNNWDRLVKYQGLDGKTVAYNQHVQFLNPVAMATDARPVSGRGDRYRGSVYHLTRELGADGVMALLGAHPKLAEPRSLSIEERIDRRMQRIQFLIHAGWHEEAAQQLELAVRDYPPAKDKVEAALKGVRLLQRIDHVATLERAWSVGRHQWTLKELAEFDPQGLPDLTRRRFQALQAKADLAAQDLKDASRLLTAAVEGVELPQQRKILGEAVSAVLAEVDAESVSRLETFLTQAREAERKKKDGVQPTFQPPELVSLAVTGWLLGNTASEAKVDAAERLWNAREMVLKYEQTEKEADRQKLLADWLAQKDGAIAIDELAQLIGLLPPAEAEAKFSETATELTTLRGGKQKYQLQLPAEYRHGRRYPLLIVCHSGSESARDAFERWATQAWLNGFILAVPEWGKGGLAQGYFCTSEEHEPVLNTVRDLKRRFNVDSDRVFLAGLREGAEMCYDVATAHPDLFAGVLPMSGTPAQIVQHCRRNAQYLPFYVTSGDRAGDVYRENYYLFKDWILQKYPMLYVTYKGRGVEYFGEEMKPSFDWMHNKQRVFPIKQLGVSGLGGAAGSEFITMKPSANRFYWLSTDPVNGLDPVQIVEKPLIGNKRGGKFQGTIAENQFSVRTVSLKQVTIWLGRDRAGQNMVDLEKPVVVYINGALRQRKMVTPSVATMLEDLFDRGDRRQLYYARLDFNL